VGWLENRLIFTSSLAPAPGPRRTWNARLLICRFGIAQSAT